MSRNSGIAVFANRDFRLFQGGRLIAVIGTQMQSVAIGWQIYEVTRRPMSLGYVGLAQFLPAIGFSLFTGHVADRFDRRRILLTYYAVMVACSAALFYFASTTLLVLPIYGVLFVIGTARAFAGPASQALLVQLVPTEQFSNAVAWSSGTWQLATILGPALGGFVYASFGGHGGAVVYAVAAVTYLAAFMMLRQMRIRTGRMEPSGISWNTLLAGLRFVYAKKIIFGAMSFDLFAVLLGGAVALMPAIARDVLHVGPKGLGILRSAPGAGAALTALVLAYHPVSRRAGAWMFACVAIFGLATIGFGLSTSFVVSVLCLFVIGASDMVSVVIRHILVQISTPNEMRGRVSAVNIVCIGASNELGEFESGLTAAWLGVVPAVLFGGIGTLLVVAIWSMLFPSLRNVDKMGESAEPAPG